MAGITVVFIPNVWEFLISTLEKGTNQFNVENKTKSVMKICIDTYTIVAVKR